MVIGVDREGSIAGLANSIKHTLQDNSVTGLMILCCDANDFTPQTLNPLVQQLSVPVFGGIFPALIYAKELLKKGSLVFPFTTPISVHSITNLSDTTADFDTLLNEQIIDFLATNTLFTFVDGLSTRISALIESLFNFYGLEINYIGGGSGSLSFQQKPCIITPQGLLVDAAVLAQTKVQSSIGVQHGWEPISGPFRVTAADGNSVHNLEHEPAFDLYRKEINKYSGMDIHQDNFFECAKEFPLGINKLGNEKVLRDLVILDENRSLVAIGDVPVGSYVHILHANKAMVTKAAKKAAQFAQKSFPAACTAKYEFFIDCISRVLFLDKDFDKELEAANIQDLPLFGALTLGEIANNGREFLEFYNKTSVVGILGD